MVCHHRDDTLSGDPLDREIAALLQVDPSPQFVARVRSSVDARPIAADRRGWLAARWIAVAATTAVIVVSVAVMLSRHSVDVPIEDVVSRRVPAVEATKPPSSIVSEAPVQDPPTRRRRSDAPRSNSSEVVISERDSAGLRYFLTALHDGRLDSTALLTEPADLDANAPIVIEPLTVDPLVTAADLEAGVSQ